jgi:hypothetical protein
MTKGHAHEKFQQILNYFNSIAPPKYRNADIDQLKENYEKLQALKYHLGHHFSYLRLVNAVSQIIARIEAYQSAATQSEWSNLSERGMNKVIPAILKTKVQSFPVEWTDKWGNACSVSNGYWGGKNFRVMDALGNMFVMNEGGDCLPKKVNGVFDDLFEIELLENQLNGVSDGIVPTGHYIRFTDDQFRQFTRLNISSSDILNLLHETSRVEFKLTFPVRLKSTGAKENTHRMHYFSRFFEFGYEDVKVKSNGVVMERRYHVVFNTLLGKMFVNNLLAFFNDRIDAKLYFLPESAQLFYRRALLNNNYKTIPIYLETIAGYAGLKDGNLSNLIRTVETNILDPLSTAGFIDGYEKNNEKTSLKYTIKRSEKKTAEVPKEAGSVKDEAGSVKK